MAKPRMTEKRRERLLKERIQRGEVTLVELGLEEEVKPNKRPRGRPKGHRLSDETKAKISRARQAKGANKQLLPLAPSDVDLAIVEIVCARDNMACRACDEPYIRTVRGPDKKPIQRVNSAADLKVHRFAKADSDPENPVNYALLCSFCRSTLTAGSDAETIR